MTAHGAGGSGGGDGGGEGGRCAGPAAPPGRRRIAVVGGGWAGLAAAVEAAGRGHAVVLHEMAPGLGGRARRVDHGGLVLDNGQHVLVGACVQTLALMARVGVDPARSLLRMPLALRYPDGGGLALPRGPAAVAFLRGVLGARGWSLGERLALLVAAAGWARRGFRCDAGLSVADLAARLPRRVRDELIDPLAVAALNTPATEASAAVFLRLVRDALFGGAGASDLLLPTVDLGALFPDAAARFLAAHGGELRTSSRVGALARVDGGWAVDGERCDAVVLAASAAEAARLAAPHAPAWAAGVVRLRHQPIVTALVRGEGARLPLPMLALRCGPDAPAQFAFDLGRLRGLDGVIALVASGAEEWVERGPEATAGAMLRQAREALAAHAPAGFALLRVHAEKRATFACTPGLERPAAHVTEGLVAAGDYVEGPYPATLEGAVRSGVAAAQRVAPARSASRARQAPAARRGSR